MAHLTYEESKKRVMFGLYLLAGVTLAEVIFSLAGKGHIIPGIKGIGFVSALVGLLLVGFSLYKAYFIVFEFMHMKYEVKSLVRSVLIPTVLLFWAIIAFFMEGNYWKNSRAKIQEKNAIEAEASLQPRGNIAPVEKISEHSEH